MVHTVDALLDTYAQIKKLIGMGLTQYVVVCHLDKKTCLECARHDLKIYDLIDGPKPPFHNNCRCRIKPVMELDSGFRFAKNTEGKTIKVPATMTYGEWRETYWPQGSVAKESVITNDGRYGSKTALVSDGIDWGMPNMEQANAVCNALSKYQDASLYNEKEMQIAHKVIVDGIIKGAPFKEIAQNLFQDINHSFEDCCDLVCTVMAQANIDASLKSLKECGLKQYQISCVLDKTTCPLCGAYDQKVYGLADGPKPPFHKNCRCHIGTMLPANPMLKRAARDENGVTIHVPIRMTWSEWRKIYVFGTSSLELDHKKFESS